MKTNCVHICRCTCMGVFPFEIPLTSKIPLEKSRHRVTARRGSHASPPPDPPPAPSTPRLPPQIPPHTESIVIIDRADVPKKINVAPPLCWRNKKENLFDTSVSAIYLAMQRRHETGVQAFVLGVWRPGREALQKFGERRGGDHHMAQINAIFFFSNVQLYDTHVWIRTFSHFL